MIFGFSSQSAESSGELSGSFTDTVLSLLPSYQELSPPEQVAVVSVAHELVRSAAHIATFAALGFCIRMLVQCYALRHAFLTAWGSGIAAALCDESLQYLLAAGRAFELVDLAKDWLGSLLGIGVAAAILSLINSRSKKQEEQ